MTYTAIILAAAAKAKVAGVLLLAICSYESSGLNNIITYNDGKSHSYGICQIKLETAEMVGFQGTAENLMNPAVNAKWAAAYLKYQENRPDDPDGGYGPDDWCKLTAAYNAGRYNESSKYPGYPRNLVYVRRVQKYLATELKDRLSCRQE